MGTGKRGGQPGNLNALKISFLFKTFSKGGGFGSGGSWKPEGRDRDDAGGDQATLEDGARLKRYWRANYCAEYFGIGFDENGGTLRAQKFLGMNRDRLDDLVDSVREDILKEWAWK